MVGKEDLNNLGKRKTDKLKYNDANVKDEKLNRVNFRGG